MHGHGVHEECLDGAVVGDTPTPARVGLHPIDEDLHLGLQCCHELV